MVHFKANKKKGTTENSPLSLFFVFLLSDVKFCTSTRMSTDVTGHIFGIYKYHFLKAYVNEL